MKPWTVRCCIILFVVVAHFAKWNLLHLRGMNCPIGLSAWWLIYRTFAGAAIRLPFILPLFCRRFFIVSQHLSTITFYYSTAFVFVSHPRYYRIPSQVFLASKFQSTLPLPTPTTFWLDNDSHQQVSRIARMEFVFVFSFLSLRSSGTEDLGD